MKDVIVMGCDGYIGHALTLRLLESGYRVIGIDDFQRRENVEEMESFSAVEIQDAPERHEIFKHTGIFEFAEFSIDEDLPKDWLSQFDPIAVVNLAQQPSGPYSFKSQQHAEFTTTNNLIGTLNVLYYLKEKAPKAHLIQIGSMGEYDHSAGTKIPEGLFDLIIDDKVASNSIFPRRPGSFYHASKVAATYYIDAACRWWGLSATDIMQGVVYGNWTPEIARHNCPTRLDTDECFGTVVNRFIVQALLGEPMTIYGEGLQQRGYLSLTDSVQCLMLAIEHPAQPGEYRTWNQLDKAYSVVEIAHKIDIVCRGRFGIETTIEHIDTPRIEKTCDFYYDVVTDKLKLLGFNPTRTIADETGYIIEKLWHNRSELYPLSTVVKPKITWK
jgi:nucleoside-diphosphate-sugar epimerase